MKPWRYGILFTVLAVVFLLSQCNHNNAVAEKEGHVYLNHHDTVKYVGMETCRSCHSDIYKTFIHTGMGQSFGWADTAKSIANIRDTSLLYDPHLNMFYQPFWKNDSLYVKEFRLQSEDTTYQQIRKINYVIGSGQHTNSHLVYENGYLFQAPFTWYAQKGKLDLPPGFEGGFNSRFGRPIGLECMSCHNAMPTNFVAGSTNKFSEIDLGINCERCHGPGEAHVKKIMAGNITDTSQAVDYSIVNPRKLSTQLQFELCQRCHLQGNTVLQAGKSFFDFKPGMRLNEVMEVYLPRYANAEDKFIMASHVDRFKQSACFIENPNQFNCTSCHNPHLSVKKTKVERFNQQCKNCHSQNKPRFECTAPMSALEKAGFNCVDCHMPSSSSVDIPHVTVHDHYIRKPAEEKAEDLERKFLGLVAINQENPSIRNKTLAYLQQYERFAGRPVHLDSAWRFLQKLPRDHGDYLRLRVYYYHLAQRPKEILALVDGLGLDSTLEALGDTSWQNEHAWTSYRIAEALKKLGKNPLALAFFERAVQLAPYVMDFRVKLAAALESANRREEAIAHYEFVLREMPRHQTALNNLGFIRIKEGNFTTAERLLKRAIAENPDYELAWLNLASLAFQTNNFAQAKRALKEVLRINPQHPKAAQLLNQLNAQP